MAKQPLPEMRWRSQGLSTRTFYPAPFSIEELEIGLRSLDRGDVNLTEFWDENILGFRQTVLFAIRETSDALLSPKLTLPWRLELEAQLEALVRYIKLADRYIERLPRGPLAFASQDSPNRSTTH